LVIVVLPPPLLTVKASAAEERLRPPVSLKVCVALLLLTMPDVRVNVFPFMV
jgi:hypothetical protein